MRLMLELALRQKNGPVFLKEIARTQEISSRYLEQLVLNLKIAGLVKSIRGSKGGFILGKPPDKITLLEIYQASEGSLAIVECLDNPKACKWSSWCASRQLWDEIKKGMYHTLSKRTLSDLAELHRHNQPKKEATYYI